MPRPSAELSTVEWKKVICFYRACGVRHITFTGGEPTTREDLPELIEHAHNLGFTLGIVTNGRAVTSELLKIFKRNDVLVSISVPGIKSFAAHTGVDNVDNVLSLFTECKNIGLETVANIAVTKKNIDELYENVALPILHGASYVLLNRFLPGGRGMFGTEFMLDRRQIITMLETADEVLDRSGTDGHVGTELPYCIVENVKLKRLQVSTECGAAKGFFVTDPEGYIKVCNHSPERVCKWYEVPDLQNNEYWAKFANRRYLPENCKACAHTDVCDGGCREAAHVYCGSTDSPDPALI